MSNTYRYIFLVLSIILLICWIVFAYSTGFEFPEETTAWIIYIAVILGGLAGMIGAIICKPPEVGTLAWLLILFVILTIAAATFLVTLNSRSSILIKEHAVIIGAIPIILLLIMSIVSGQKIAASRITPALSISLFALLSWIVLMHYTGIQSVNGPRNILFALALTGIAASIILIFRENHVRIVLWAILAFTTIASLYAVFHMYGIGIFSWDSGLMRSGRSAGSMGNANLLGSIAMASLPVGAGLLIHTAIRAKTKIHTYLLYAAACMYGIICTWGIVASKTRGSYIGLIALILLAPFSGFIRKGGWRRISVFVFILILVAVGILSMGDRFNDLLDDGLNIFSSAESSSGVDLIPTAHAPVAGAQESGTLGVRKLIWSGTFNMFADKPLTGWGPGSFQIIFPTYRNPSYHLLGVSHNTLHAHCEYLEILSDIGIIGFLLIIAFATSIILILRRKDGPGHSDDDDDDDVESASNTWIKLGLYGGIIALLAEASVSVALRWPPSRLLIVLFIALAISLTRSEWRKVNPIITLPAILLMLFLSVFAVKYYHDCELSAKQLFNGKDGNLTYVEIFRAEAHEYAAHWNANKNPEYANMAANKFNDAVIAANQAIEGCRESVETNPGELGGWYALGSSYLNRAVLCAKVPSALASILAMNNIQSYNPQLDEEYVLLGIAAYDSLLLRAPNYAETHNNMSMALLRIGQPEKALSSMRTAYGLYAHNRQNYIRQLEIIAPFVDNLDEIHLTWISTPQLHIGYALADDMEKGSNVINSKLIYSDLCFQIFPALADSIAESFTVSAAEYYSPLASSIEDGLEIQLAELGNSIDVSNRFEIGDTDGLLESLHLKRNIIEILPMQNAVYGALLIEADDSSGREILIELSNELIYTCFGHVLHWPLNGHLLDYAFEDIERTGLLGEGDKNDILRLEVQALILDRELFKTMQMLQSTPLYAEHVSQNVFDELNSLWRWIGGPLYCYTNPNETHVYEDSSDVSNVLLYGSFLHDLNSYIDSQAELYPEDPELGILKLKYFYILLLSFYMDVPQVSPEQSDDILGGLRKSRAYIEDLYGSIDALYQTDSAISDATEIAAEFLNSEYESIIDLLASDIKTGNIK